MFLVMYFQNNRIDFNGLPWYNPVFYTFERKNPRNTLESMGCEDFTVLRFMRFGYVSWKT